MPSGSLFRKRLRRFRSLKRGYYSFLILSGLYVLSFTLPFLVNDKALMVRYDGRNYFPILHYYPASQFGLTSIEEPNYRDLHDRFAHEKARNFVILPPYPYSATESSFDLPGSPPYSPSARHIFGSDNRGRDVFARLAYGFNLSITFALIVLVLAQVMGISAGAALGYFGGKTDLAGQRLIEIWSTLPFLYLVMIVSSILVPIYIPGRNLVLQPSFWLLVVLVSVFDWMGITYYVRGEFYREKAKDYVQAAVAVGVRGPRIIFRHILPNALTPVVSLAPFAMVANISVLVGLDFLGFGLPAPTPSWGELIGQGTAYITDWWLVLFPLGAVFLTLLLIVFIGEAVREAFDPKPFSLLR